VYRGTTMRRKRNRWTHGRDFVGDLVDGTPDNVVLFFGQFIIFFLQMMETASSESHQ